MNSNKVIALFFLFFLVNVFAFSGSSNGFDVNYGYKSDLSVVGEGNGFEVGLVLTSYSGFGEGNEFESEVGVLFLDEDLNYVPVVSIISPFEGYSTTSSNITLIYSGIVYNSFISNYWVKLNEEEWIDNGLNTQFTFSDLSLGSHVLSVKATAENDLNSSIESINVFVVSVPKKSGSQNLCSNYVGSSICSEKEYCFEEFLLVNDSLRCCPVLCVPRISMKTINSFAQFSAFEDTLSNTALNEIYSETLFEGKRIALPQEIIVSRTINSHIVFDKEKLVSADINITVHARNNSDKNYFSVSIIESIPKKLAETVSDISFVDAPRIIQINPVVEWIIPELKSKEEKKFKYSLNKINDESILIDLKSFFDSLATPTAMILITEIDLCKGIECEDNNPCTQGYCVAGKCYYSSKDGSECGTGKICYQNACINKDFLIKEEKEIIREVIEEKENPLLVLFIIVLLLVVGLLVFLLIKSKDDEIKEEKLIIKKTEQELIEAKKRIEEDEKLIKKTLEIEKELIQLKKQ